MTSSSGVRRRPWLAAPLAVAAALALSGCMKMDLALTLTEGDTASGTFVVAFSDELAEAMGAEPQELWEQGSEAVAGDLPEGATEEPYADGEYTGGRYTFAEQPVSELGGVAGEELTVTREGDEYVVSGAMDLTDDTGELESAPPELVDSFDARVAITFPGEVVDTNGEVVGTNTVEWRPPLGERTELRARGSAVSNGKAGEGAAGGAGAEDDDGEGLPLWAVAGLLLVLAIAVAAVVVIVARARRRRDADGPGGTGF
ncbi:LppM family (lipo)protein [Isoptericola variabilis]|uniref:LppM domain-containing protein n=1 Tax=Isoptericola variabilis (strain 225) TaxID=743718 RepID=F6FSV8_ISOV2|nr:hypothetical protein [Isoptericola variabilis]AEG43099.1 hypothetical protein Isova_0297 [Isoptericola variabilis 225]TWH35026.1 hypothetical protein L600_000100000300 [Isoptericola variabilis J7]